MFPGFDVPLAASSASPAAWATALAWGLAAVWGLFSAVAALAHFGVRRLPGLPRSADPGAPPRVSIVVAARDEEQRVRDTARRLLAQEGVDLEVLIVDDRSTDGTPAILDALASEHPRLRVLRVDALPPGWLGKNHACHLAAREARGDWILFTDADTWMDPDVVARALHAALADGAAHVCLFPGEDHTTLPARAALTLIMAATSPLVALANRDAAFAGIGVGAFNLVRADAYRRVGGHERIRMEVVDDLKLGRILRRAGLRTRAYDASHEMKIHWAGDVRGLVRAVDKNMFAMFGFSTAAAVLAMVVPLALWCATLVLPFSGAVAGAAAVAPLAGMATAWVPALLVARRGRLGLAAALLSPLSVPVPVAMVLNSTVRTLRQGGIRWRDTFYPLADLRRGRL